MDQNTKPIVGGLPREVASAPSGGLLIDKPTGPTSHDIIAQLRRVLGFKKIGHTGTLDPFASGLLLILLGPATRLAEYLHDFPKTYTATAILGAASTTDDATGHITPSSPTQPSRGQVADALTQLQSTTTQTPPTYAALKVDGQRLYDIARRQGSEAADKLATQKNRPITIHSLTLNHFQYPQVNLTTQVSTGTYIRAIVRDLGLLLGTHAYTQTLRRTQIGPWTEQKAITVETLKNDPQTVINHLIPPADLVAHMPSLTLDAGNVAQLQQGRKLSSDNFIDNLDSIPANQPLAIYDDTRRLIGIATYDPPTSPARRSSSEQRLGLLSPRKILPLHP